MNTFYEIEKAKVVRTGNYESGNGNNGPWASMIVLVEYEVPAANPADRPQLCKAVVAFKGDMAVFARDYVRPGNSYNNVPDQYLHLVVRPWGQIREYERKDGSGKAQMGENTLVVEKAEIIN